MTDFNKDSSQGAVSGAGTGTAAKMKEEVTDKVAAAMNFTVGVIDAQRAPAASALDKTASALHQTGDKVGGASHATGDKVQATADYLRQTDVKGMMNDVQDLVKRYPGWSLAAAAMVGVLFARGLRSND